MVAAIAAAPATTARAGDTLLYPPTVVPPPQPLPFPRFIVRFVRNPLRTIARAVYDEDMLVRDTGRRAIAYVTAPALVEEVLLKGAEHFHKSPVEKRVFRSTLGDGILTSQGPSWKWQRRTAAPLFRVQDLASLVPAMTAEGEAQAVRWRQSPQGSVHAIDEDMTETTFRVISTTMFGGAPDGETRAILAASDKALASVSWDIAAAIIDLPEWIWYPGRRARRHAGRELRAFTASMLARRRQAGLEGNDLMARLANAKDPETGAPMSESQLVDNLLTFLGAGHETTAKALTWCLYLIARAPEWQQRIFDEVQAVCGAAPIGPEHLDRLQVTRAVFKEAMRLYPPAPMMSRILTEPTTLGGRQLKAGTVVVIPIWAIHRHRKLWSDPDRFDPTRFFPEQEAKHARAQFMPFGFGPRTCIGNTFAMMEGVAILGTLVRRAVFDWDGHHLPEPLSRITLRPKGGMPLKVSMRA